MHCSSCRGKKLPDQFSGGRRTCDLCRLNKQRRRDQTPEHKRRKGRATTGPPGTLWCTARTWCDENDFKNGNSTCDKHLRRNQQHRQAERNRPQNTTLGDNVGALAEMFDSLEVQSDSDTNDSALDPGPRGAQRRSKKGRRKDKGKGGQAKGKGNDRGRQGKGHKGSTRRVHPAELDKLYTKRLR